MPNKTQDQILMLISLLSVLAFMLLITINRHIQLSNRLDELTVHVESINDKIELMEQP